MGNLQYTTFMKIFSALLRLSLRFSKEKNPDYKAKRREFLTKGQEKEYAMCIQEYMRKQNILKSMILETLLKKFEVSPQLYNKSQQFYKQDPAYAAKFQKDAASFEHAEQRQDEGCDISKDEALKYIKRIEEFKAETNAQLAFAQRIRQMPPQQMAAMTIVAKTKAFDKLWQDAGVEEEDVTRAFYHYRISETDEFKQIIEEAKALMQQKVKE